MPADAPSATGRPAAGRAASFAGCALILTVVNAAYLPYWYTYAGTDLAVYWEVAQRFAESGRLALGETYWDHKPILIYLALAPWALLGAFMSGLAALKMGVLVIYSLGPLAAFAAAARWMSTLTHSTARTLLIAPGIAACAALSLDARIDAPHNGILVVAGLWTEAAGLLLLAIPGPSSRRSIAAGILLGAAPFWRPTSIAGLAVLGICTLVTLAFRRTSPREMLTRPLVISSVAATASIFLLIALTRALGTPFATWWHVIIELNSAYGGHFRSITPVVGYFQQNQVAFAWFNGAAALIVALGIVRLLPRFRSDSAPPAFDAAALLYVALSVALAIFGRKIQNFYPYQFALPVVLGAAYFLATSPLARRRLPTIIPTAAAIAATASVLIGSLRAVPPEVWRGAFASNASMDTGVIAKVLAERAPAGNARLWVLGNRANLYGLCREHGIKPYDWTVYDLPTLTISDSEFETWMNRLRTDPPEFIVRVNNCQFAPWDSQDRVRARAGAVNTFIAERYETIPTPAPTGSSWPYRFEFVLYTRK